MKNTIKSTIVNLIERSEHNRLAKRMLLLSDRQLQDIGLSRIKLESGAKAYPWRIETTQEIMPNLSKLSSVVSFEPKVQNDSKPTIDRPRAA
ncbi:MAG: hypothetical protein ACRBHB_09120 [Arenicella sp.]